MRKWSNRSSVIARQTNPRPCFAMKLIASGVTFSAAKVKSPSFSRSSSSTTTIMCPRRISSIAVGTSVNAECEITINHCNKKCADRSRQKLLPGREGLGRSIRQKRGHRIPNERVQCIPDQVESGDLVREELNCEQRHANSDNVPIRKHFQGRRQ